MIHECHHHRLFSHCYLCAAQKALVNKTAHYNNLGEDFIPNEEKKVKDFYQCKRRCFNCGHEGVTSHERGTMAPEAVKCPNCKVLDTFLRG